MDTVHTGEEGEGNDVVMVMTRRRDTCGHDTCGHDICVSMSEEAQQG